MGNGSKAYKIGNKDSDKEAEGGGGVNVILKYIFDAHKRAARQLLQPTGIVLNFDAMR